MLQISDDVRAAMKIMRSINTNKEKMWLFLGLLTLAAANQLQVVTP